MKSNFYTSFFFLPPKEKEALISFYSLCREIDDQIDSEGPTLPLSEKREKIETWRVEIKKTFEGKPAHPLTRRLLPVIETYHLTQSYFDEIVNGMEMDLLLSSYETFEALKLYCYRVASAVGLVCMEIFGDRSENARQTAIHLGIAFQLTNILRDIFIDLEKGRIYLPGEDFQRFAYSRENLKNRIVNLEFSTLIQFEIDRAKLYYEKAEKGIRQSDHAGKKTIDAMLNTYYQLLLKIERNIWNLERETVSLSFLKKISIAGKIWLGRKEVNPDSRY